MPISCFIIISVLFMNGYLVILTVAPKLYINTVSLSIKRLKSHRSAIFGSNWDCSFQKTTKGTDALVCK